MISGVNILINGKPCVANTGCTVAALLAGMASRRSPAGEHRAAFCGMGCCFECRVTINGNMHQRGCQIVIMEGMEIWCDE